jgi:hypothetical protein
LDKAPLPRVVVPSRNVTVPVGVPVAGATGKTVAVNVIFCPTAAGFWEEVTAAYGAKSPMAYRL